MYGDFGYIWNPRESPILTGLYDYIYISHTHIYKYIYIYAGWWFGTFGLFSPSYWESSSKLTFIVFRGVGIPPTIPTGDRVTPVKLCMFVPLVPGGMCIHKCQPF
jgi:hypothetical protein